MIKPRIQILTGHGESVTPRKSKFGWFFRCLSVLACDVFVSDCFRLSASPDLVFVGDPQAIISEEEVRAILQFVETGGALLVLGKYGGDRRQNTNLSDLTPGLSWENTLIKSVGRTTYPVVIQNDLWEKRWTDYLSGFGLLVDCPCGLKYSEDSGDWTPLLRVADPVFLKSPSYDRLTKAYVGTPANGMSTVVSAACEIERGRILAVGSRWMFSNALMGHNTFFLSGVINWLLRHSLSHSSEGLRGLCRPDAEVRLQELVGVPENLFCLLAVSGFYQAVLHDDKIGKADLGVPWCEPVWIQDSFSKCIARMRKHPKVFRDNREVADYILMTSEPEEILSLVRQFPLNSDKSREILKVRGLCEAFLRFQVAVEAEVLA